MIESVVFSPDGNRGVMIKQCAYGIYPIKKINNLYYNSNDLQPMWSKHHPFHWLAKAEKGDGNSMIELGSIYLRDDNIKQAKHWFNKAKALPEFEHIANQRLQLINKL